MCIVKAYKCSGSSTEVVVNNTTTEVTRPRGKRRKSLCEEKKSLQGIVVPVPHAEQRNAITGG